MFALLVYKCNLLLCYYYDCYTHKATMPALKKKRECKACHIGKGILREISIQNSTIVILFSFPRLKHKTYFSFFNNARKSLWDTLFQVPTHNNIQNSPELLWKCSRS